VHERRLQLPVLLELLIAQLGVEGIRSEESVDLRVIARVTFFELEEVLLGEYTLDDVHQQLEHLLVELALRVFGAEAWLRQHEQAVGVAQLLRAVLHLLDLGLQQFRVEALSSAKPTRTCS